MANLVRKLIPRSSGITRGSGRIHGLYLYTAGTIKQKVPRQFNNGLKPWPSLALQEIEEALHLPASQAQAGRSAPQDEFLDYHCDHQE